MQNPTQNSYQSSLHQQSTSNSNTQVLYNNSQQFPIHSTTTPILQSIYQSNYTTHQQSTPNSNTQVYNGQQPQGSHHRSTKSKQKKK